MAAYVLCRRVPRVCFLPGLRKEFTQVQHMRVDRVDETDNQEGKKEVLQCQEASLQEGYQLYYNPGAYHHPGWNSATSSIQTDNEEDECLSTRVPSFWQQSNRYSVSCSRHLCSSQNTILDLAFNKDSEPKTPSVSLYHKNLIPPVVKVDARAFLKCRAEYASMTLDLSQRPQPIEWEEAFKLLQKVAVLRGHMKPSDVSQIFVQLSRLHPHSISLVRNDHRFIMLLRYSVEHLRLFTLPELLDVLQSFVWLDMPSAHSVLDLYEAELSARVDQMSQHQLLLAADLWRCIGRLVPKFLQKLYASNHLHLRQMGVPEMVHLLYIMGEDRQCPTDLIQPVEKLLMRHLNHLLPEEVGTVCLGLFKSQTSISATAVTRLVDKAHSFVEEMSDFAMVNVLKFLRFSYLYHKAWLEAMAQEVPRRANRMGVEGLMHVALTCSALHCRDDKILMAISERVPLLAPHCRSKDSCKLLWAFGTLGFLPDQSPNLYPSLIEAMRQRKIEFHQYPEHLLTGLLGLAFVSQFPEDLIALALSPEFVNLALKSKQLELRKDLFTLDETVGLELPHWTGPRLSSKLKEEVAEMLWKFVQSSVCSKPEVQEAESALQDLLGGETFVRKRMILPHTRSIDLEVHLDSSGQPIPVNTASNALILSPEKSSSEFPSHQSWGRMDMGVTITEDLLAQLTHNKNTVKPLTPSPTVKPAFLHRVQPDEGDSVFGTVLDINSVITEALTRPSNIVKLAIQVPGRNHYCLGSQQLLGLYAMKRRQLKLAGYQVVELSYQTWSPLLRKSRAEKVAYLNCMVYNSV